MSAGKISTEGLRILHGTALDRRLQHERQILISCLGIAVDAMKFDDSLVSRAALRRIAEVLRAAGLEHDVQEIRDMSVAGA